MANTNPMLPMKSRSDPIMEMINETLTYEGDLFEDEKAHFSILKARRKYIRQAIKASQLDGNDLDDDDEVGPGKLVAEQRVLYLHLLFYALGIAETLEAMCESRGSGT